MAALYVLGSIVQVTGFVLIGWSLITTTKDRDPDRVLMKYKAWIAVGQPDPEPPTVQPTDIKVYSAGLAPPPTVESLHKQVTELEYQVTMLKRDGAKAQRERERADAALEAGIRKSALDGLPVAWAGLALSAVGFVLVTIGGYPS